MKQYKHTLILITLLLTSFFSWSQSKYETVAYNIHALGMDVGTMTVNQEIRGDEVLVEAISLVEVRIIFKIRVKYIQTSVYRNGVMQEASLKTYKKEEVNSDTRLTKQESGGYTLDKKGEISFVDDVINYSGSLLYFHEPTDGTEMYFEINGEKTVVKSFGEHKYIIADPENGNENEYYYTNGILQKAIIKHAVTNVYLNIIDDSKNITTTD
jgi:hypothetical protein